MADKKVTTLRRARVDDVPGIAAVMARYVEDGTLLPRSVGELYRSVPEFHVAVDDAGKVVAMRRAPHPVERPRRGALARGAARGAGSGPRRALVAARRSTTRARSGCRASSR